MAFLGGCLFFVGLLMVVLLVTLGDIPGPFLEFGSGSVVVGLSLVYVAYGNAGSLLSTALISFGSGVFFLGSIILIVAWATKDAFYPIPHIGTGLVLGGILSVYISYRKLAKELIESENQLLRY
jgi:hypothetical protein